MLNTNIHFINNAEVVEFDMTHSVQVALVTHMLFLRPVLINPSPLYHTPLLFLTPYNLVH